MTIDWPALFAVYPNNPEDHLVCADYYEDQDWLDAARDHRQRAEFWSWVKEQDVEPRNFKSHGFWWYDAVAKEDHPEGSKHCIDTKIYEFLPEDVDGDTGKTFPFLVYDGKEAAWEALYIAWCRAREAAT